MAWSETNPMRERLRFISDLETCLYSMSELCEMYGISRKTGYKWAERYAAEGLEGLADRSRAPNSCPHRIRPEIREAILDLRHEHPTWGPRKLRTVLKSQQPEQPWPAASTIGDLLKREGLVKARPRRSRPPHPGRPRFEARAPNDVWSIDFKGDFLTGDRRKCYPLTVVDQRSRYLLSCQGLDGPRGAPVRRILESLFEAYGLPQAILSDNGTPFSSSTSLSRLSRLSVWWLKLGIEPLLIEPGRPEQNGRHERLHRTLKEDTARPPAKNLATQQERFDQFRRIYNEQRPHEALEQQPPATIYTTSGKPYPRTIPEPEYPGHYHVRRVRRTGEIKWKGATPFLSETLAGELVGLEEVDEGVWSVYFGERLLKRISHQEISKR